MITETEQVVYLVTCDRTGCLRPDWIPAVSEVDAVEQAAADGWEVHGNRHVCPSCLATDGIPHHVLAADAAYSEGVPMVTVADVEDSR